MNDGERKQTIKLAILNAMSDTSTAKAARDLYAAMDKLALGWLQNAWAEGWKAGVNDSTGDRPKPPTPNPYRKDQA